MAEVLRGNLDLAGELTEVVLNALSLIFIIVGVIASMIKSLQERKAFKNVHPLHLYFRIALGGWLVVALEFQLAADIVGTIISPTTTRLVELGAVALIRTFLNYFLNRELKEQVELTERALKNGQQERALQMNG